MEAMSQQSHRSSPQVLGRRTLEGDHRRLDAYLCSGAEVLDVGCGTGAITAGIARRVGTSGAVLGVDRDLSLLALARAEYGDVPYLAFEPADAIALPFQARFDVVTAARTLQWIGDPAQAVRCMTRAAKPGGVIVILDYNQRQTSWRPEPPADFVRFYQAFLDWRAANDWDNEMADHLPAMFHAAGLTGVEIHVDDEVTDRAHPLFAEIAGIWSHVIADAGPGIVAAGFLSESERLVAAARYQEYVARELATQTLVMRTVAGRVQHPR